MVTLQKNNEKVIPWFKSTHTILSYSLVNCNQIAYIGFKNKSNDDGMKKLDLHKIMNTMGRLQT